MKKLLLCFCLTTSILIVFIHRVSQAKTELNQGTISQPTMTVASEQWITVYHLNNNASYTASDITQTKDGGYIIAGGNYWDDVLWLIKLNSDSSIAWQKSYPLTGYDRAISISETADGDFWVVGRSLLDIWVLKLTSEGQVIWQKTYGDSDTLLTQDAHLTPQGNLMILARDSQHQTVLLNLASDGSIIWQKTYASLIPEAVIATSDGGFVITGYAPASETLVVAWVLKTDEEGNLIWAVTYSENDALSTEGHIIHETSDGGFILAGENFSLSDTNEIDIDAWFVKLSNDGQIIWQKTYRGTSQGTEVPVSIQQTSEGGFLVVGNTYNSLHPTFIWLIKLDEDGNFLWEKNYLSTENSGAAKLQITTDGDIILLGSTNSFNAQGNYGDIVVMKLSADGDVSDCSTCSVYGEGSSIGADSLAITAPYTITMQNLSFTIQDTSAAPEVLNFITKIICQSGTEQPIKVTGIFTAVDLPDTILLTLSTPHYWLVPQYTLNGGKQWDETAEPSPLGYYRDIRGISSRTNPQYPVRMFANTHDFLYRSGDWGQTWAETSAPYDDFAISPIDSQHLYLSSHLTESYCNPFPPYGCYDVTTGYLYENTDGSLQWNLYILENDLYFDALYPSPANPSDGFYHATNGFWRRFVMNENLTFPVDLIALDAIDSNRIYGVTENFLSGQTSPDGGITWIPWASSPPLACVQLMAHPTKTNTLYLRCAAGLFRSPNGGDSWTQITPIQGDALAPHLGIPGQILWSHDGCLLASDTDGDSWNLVTCFTTYPEKLYLPILTR